MAKNNPKTKQGFWRKLLSFLSIRSNQKVLDSEKKKKEPKSFAIEWATAFDTWKKKLPTKQINSGIVVETKKIRLTKTNEKLFRIEGDDFSIVLVTDNHLYKNKDGKWAGVLFIDEGLLNQNLSKDIRNLDDFLNLQAIPRSDLFLESEAPKDDWRIVFGWERFWQEQLLLQMSPNSMTLVMLAIGEECKEFFETIATERQKRLVRDELFYLNLGQSNSSNPHSKTKSIFGFGSALKEFGQKINLIRERREKELEHGA
ncbi:hypothetical protein EHQ92_11410 [Leptospira biflexa]|uniref:LBBP_01157 family protein n=1 Tax=Leptospira biflexa TaxID=172 RepID=UPI001083C89E|nr:hypothetical protein [Leptospira biflexa]TGM34390.1 hypothetical protein EHQ89_14520 [Leptospira biflexa]TGM39956.1 hypothetical protein EHQ80_01810 [Leptospira biflexa]TGM48451.1 hypothetical protein EHQ92_11410 [Leptospira biflexa]TGM49083.1 hypothetical protein EHQ88_01665 [Leptospira biflexa]